MPISANLATGFMIAFLAIFLESLCIMLYCVNIHLETAASNDGIMVLLSNEIQEPEHGDVDDNEIPEV